MQVLNRTDPSGGEVMDASALDVVHHTVPSSLGSGMALHPKPKTLNPAP